MNSLERFVWNVRGEASRKVVREYETLSDAVFFAGFFWAISAGLAYVVVAAVSSSKWIAAGLVMFVLVAAVWGALETTVALKYYLTEWTSAVRRPEGDR